MASIDLLHCAAGGNRHPSAADWAPGLLAFGAGHNLALWNPEDISNKGIYALLHGHSDTINAVRIYDKDGSRCILTGAADSTIRIWRRDSESSSFKAVQVLEDHRGSINVISTSPDCGIFVSGSADGTVKVWKLDDEHAKTLHSISLKPRYLPLTCSLADLGEGALLLAVGGTSTSVQLYCRETADAVFQLQATLTGHESWIPSLDFGRDINGDTLLASASQDKYIRLWRLRHAKTAATAPGDPSSGLAAAPAPSLSNKAHLVGSAENKYSVSFEALLVGHEDWIYTARWKPGNLSDGNLTLLSASADNSLSIWEADESSNIWVCRTRLGEISAQKGSTTATGSTGGFWIGLWSPSGHQVASLGRTGSWRRWAYSDPEDSWLQQIGISGHTKEVQGCSWSFDGSYLLSTSSDQTTRMLAEWRRDSISSWHEFARPQIHGYDLNSIASIGANSFVSGADEKLLRVFAKPRSIQQLLQKLSGIEPSADDQLPDTANIPVLGLSNKTVESDAEPTNGTADDHVGNGVGEDAIENEVPKPSKHTLDLTRPPLEEHLARHTLWPEQEKLYGHGYEISTVASTHDGSLIATACKASSIDHAVIRLYDCQHWREVKPPLTAHSLTVTSLAFSADDNLLLSVSRDRSWFICQRDAQDRKQYKVLCSNAKAHSRMILDCAWAPAPYGSLFATAGRDKAVKLWKFVDGKADLVQSLSADAAVTAVAFQYVEPQWRLKLAYGTEDGTICVINITADGADIESRTTVDRSMAPSAAINALSWRPGTTILAAASDDGSVRLFDIRWA